MTPSSNVAVPSSWELLSRIDHIALPLALLLACGPATQAPAPPPRVQAPATWSSIGAQLSSACVDPSGETIVARDHLGELTALRVRDGQALWKLRGAKIAYCDQAGVVLASVAVSFGPTGRQSELSVRVLHYATGKDKWPPRKTPVDVCTERDDRIELTGAPTPDRLRFAWTSNYTPAIGTPNRDPDASPIDHSGCDVKGAVSLDRTTGELATEAHFVLEPRADYTSSITTPGGVTITEQIEKVPACRSLPPISMVPAKDRASLEGSRNGVSLWRYEWLVQPDRDICVN